MKILWFHHDAQTPTQGGTLRHYYLSKEWVQKGHEVFIVSSSYSHLRYKQPQVNKNEFHEIVDGINYIWLKTPSFKKNNIKRAYNIIHFAIQAYNFTKRMTIIPDVVISASTHGLDIFAARRVAQHFSIPLVREVRDLWPMTLMELGGLPYWHPFVAIIQKAEDISCQSSDLVVSNQAYSYKHLITRGMSLDKFLWIPNGIYLQKNEKKSSLPGIVEKYLDEASKRKSFLIGYAGAYGTWNNLNVIIEAANYLRNYSIDWFFVGKGPEKEKLANQIRSMGLNNIYLLDPIPKDSVLHFLKKMDALILSVQESALLNYGISLNKIFDYLLAARPIVAAVGTLSNPVNEAKAGFSTAVDPIEIASAIKTLISMSPDKRIQMGNNGKRYVLREHNYKVLAQKYLNALEKVKKLRR